MDNGQIERQIYDISFNQDKSIIKYKGCFSISTDIGFSIRQTYPHFKAVDNLVGSIQITRMLYQSNLIIIVGGGNNPKYESNKLIVWDQNNQTICGELVFQSQIQQILIKSDILVVILAMKIYTFLFPTLQLHKIFETNYNPTGLCCLNYFGVYNILSFPLESGTVFLDFENHDLVKDEDYLNQNLGYPTTSLPKNYTKKMHSSNIQCMELNKDGSLLATASKKGTLIRILDVFQQEVTGELRRGSQQAIIQSICFKEDDRFLACSSDTGTIHIFNLQSLKQNKYSSLKFMNGIFSYFGSQWSFQQIQIKDLKDQKCFLGFPAQQDDILTVVAQNGMYFLVEFDKEKGTSFSQKFTSLLF